MMKSMDNWLFEYSQTHKHKVNKMIHYICVPAIYSAILGMLTVISLPAIIRNMISQEYQVYANFGTLLSTIALLYYILLNWKLTVGLGLWTLACSSIIYKMIFINLPVLDIFLLIFLVAWILQFIGHKIEGKKPAFLEDIQFLMIGPAWTISHIYDLLGINYNKRYK